MRLLFLKKAEIIEGFPFHSWKEHIYGDLDGIYCRRIGRRYYARQRALKAKLPEGELLLGDWLIAPSYLEVIERLTARLLQPPKPA